jgi:hypothetical protein
MTLAAESAAAAAAAARRIAPPFRHVAFHLLEFARKVPVLFAQIYNVSAREAVKPPE